MTLEAFYSIFHVVSLLGVETTMTGTPCIIYTSGGHTHIFNNIDEWNENASIDDLLNLSRIPSKDIGNSPSSFLDNVLSRVLEKEGEMLQAPSIDNTVSLQYN